MNYYEHHLGDYMRDTAHLSLLEDGAYRRLLDAYYVREKPLPADVRDCCKLARATSKAERDAVAYVLREFFTLGDDGHRQGRADEEITRFKAKSEKARASVNARWERNRNESESHAERSTNVVPTQYERNTDDIHRAPVPRHQTPDTKEEAHASSARGRVGKALKAVGMDLGRVNLSDPRLTALLDQGATPDEFEGIAKEAVAGHKGFAWVLTVLQSRRAEAAAITLAPKAEDLTPWHETRSGIEAKGASLGLGKWDEEAFQQGRGEQWPAYRNRVFKAAGHTAMERVA